MITTCLQLAAEGLLDAPLYFQFVLGAAGYAPATPAELLGLQEPDPTRLPLERRGHRARKRPDGRDGDHARRARPCGPRGSGATSVAESWRRRMHSSSPARSASPPSSTARSRALGKHAHSWASPHGTERHEHRSATRGACRDRDRSLRGPRSRAVRRARAFMRVRGLSPPFAKEGGQRTGQQTLSAPSRRRSWACPARPDTAPNIRAVPEPGCPRRRTTRQGVSRPAVSRRPRVVRRHGWGCSSRRSRHGC